MYNLTNLTDSNMDREPIWIGFLIIGILGFLVLILICDEEEKRYKNVVICFWPCLIVEDLCLLFCSCVKCTSICFKTAAHATRQAVHVGLTWVRSFHQLRLRIEIPHASEVLNPTQVIVEFSSSQFPREGPTIVVVNQIQANGIESWVNPVIAENI